jgi:Transglutaminase-like superfamily
MSATWQAQIELRSRTLVDGPSENPVAALPMLQRTAALAVTSLIDWTSEAFQNGLDTADLRPHEGEHAIAFAQRVLHHVRSLDYSYTVEMDRCASHVLSSGTSDCGGLGGLTVATLRAAGIPARLLVGRWAKTAKPTDQLEGLPYGQWHVKFEFYVDDIGWIPADAAIEMHDPTAWFGRQNADFITLHVDPGVRVKTLFGERELLWAQGIACWIRGDGSLDNKTVDETLTVTPVRQPTILLLLLLLLLLALVPPHQRNGHQ